MPKVTIVNIGLGEPDLLNQRTVRTLKESNLLILRTSRSPIVSWLRKEGISFSSLDELYDTVDDFDQLFLCIAHKIWSQASGSDVVYAVSDMLTDRSVRALYEHKPQNGEITVVPGTGMTDILHSKSLPYLHDSDFRSVAATDFLQMNFNPRQTILITELDNEILAGEVKIHLSSILNDEQNLIYLHENQCPEVIHLFELDRRKDISHLSAVLLPGTGFLQRSRFVLDDLVQIMDCLRSAGGCPWDRSQTHRSLRPYLIEEAWECVAAIDQNDYEHLADELGDLLFQIVFHSSIGKDFDEFSLNDVISDICSKMIRRHPHVFADKGSFDDKSWESIKQRETGHLTPVESLNDVSEALPSLKYAAKTYKKAYRIPGLRKSSMQVVTELNCILSGSWSDPDSPVSRLGHILLLCSELCFINNADSEMLLHQAVDHFKSRLKTAEERIKKDGKNIESLTFEELGVYLQYVEGEIE